MNIVMKIFVTFMINDILHLWLVEMSAVGMCREQILHLWSITTLTGETKPSFLFHFISMLAKFSLNLTRCLGLMRHFMKCKNYTKFFGCKIEGMHSGWVVWYSVVKNITLFNNLPVS